MKGRRRRRKSGQTLAGSARPPRWLRLVAESDRLSSSLIRTTFLFYTFFATTVTAIQVYVSYSSRLDETVKNITRLTQQIAPSLAQAVWEFNDPQIAAVMKIVEEQGAVESVALFNATGEALYPTKESSGKEAHWNLNDDQLSQLVASKVQASGDNLVLKASLVEVTTPVTMIDEDTAEKKELGFLFAGVSEARVLGGMKEDILVVVLNSFLKTAVMMLLLTVVTNRIISQPVRYLTWALQRIDPRHPLQSKELAQLKTEFSDRRDELGYFVGKFHTLSTEIAERTEKISHLNDNLEQKVWERTRDIRTILTGIPQVVVIIDDEFRLKGEPSALAHALYDPKELCDSDVLNVLLKETDLTHDERATVRSRIECAWGMDAALAEAYTNGLPRDWSAFGRKFEVDWIFMPNPQNEIDSLLFVARDVTELRQQKALAQQRDEQMRRLISLLKVGSEKFQAFQKNWHHTRAVLTRLAEAPESSDLLSQVKRC